jgi:thioredoxin reductase
MYDLIIIGAGPGGIALAAEACASGINRSQILVLEKGATHNSAIRQLYPEQKLTTANYKGFEARYEGGTTSMTFRWRHSDIIRISDCRELLLHQV